MDVYSSSLHVNADSRPKSLTWSEGRQLLGAILHSYVYAYMYVCMFVVKF